MRWPCSRRGMVGWPARCRKPPSTTIIIVDDGPYPRMVRRLRRNDGPEALDDAIIPEITLHAEQRSEEHTSELQSLMRTSYAVFCLTKKKTNNKKIPNKTAN